MALKCSKCGRSGTRACVVQFQTMGGGLTKSLCRWCRSARTRVFRQRLPEVIRAAQGRRDAQARRESVEGARREESSIPTVAWALALILFFAALGFYSCKARLAEAETIDASQRYWEYVTESGVAWTDDPERIPKRYKPTARERECGSIFDYERTTIVQKKRDG